jgi:transposase
MEVLYPRCAGLDVHKDTVVACVRCVIKPQHREVRTFGTTSSDLSGLAEWLASHGCTHVAMEATGVYWKPVWRMLEGRFGLVHLQLIGALQSALESLDASAGKLLAPIQERAALLTTMPGVSDIVAQVIVAEIGVDMSRFPSGCQPGLLGWSVPA